MAADLPRFDGLSVVVVGLARSGIAAARLLARQGARVTVNDRKPEDELALALAELPVGVTRALGGHPVDIFTSADLIVLSPGVPELPALAAAREKGVPIIGEIELGARFVLAPLVAITGTNGKSTTTTLCGDMLAATGRPTFVGGNLGVPLSEAAFSPAAGRGGFVVAEVSSFQLETITTFHPRVGVLLNITADHLDRYAGMDAYAAAKARLFENQGGADFAVLNVDDPRVATIGRKLTPSVVPLSTTRVLETGGWVEKGDLHLRLAGGALERYPGDLPALTGRHNQENALAAALAARLCGATPGEVERGLRGFRALPHRMTLVGEADGVVYYDDSKGTNVGAVVAALSGFPRKVVLIAGGRDKGGSYEPLAQALRLVGRGAVVIGEAGERIGLALAGVVPVESAGSMVEAVAAARRLAQPGDAVVLSPACSSFDMFTSYAHRGDVFRTAVETVLQGPKGKGEGKGGKGT